MHSVHSVSRLHTHTTAQKGRTRCNKDYSLFSIPIPVPIVLQGLVPSVKSYGSRVAPTRPYACLPCAAARFFSAACRSVARLYR